MHTLSALSSDLSDVLPLCIMHACYTMPANNDSNVSLATLQAQTMKSTVFASKTLHNEIWAYGEWLVFATSLKPTCFAYASHQHDIHNNWPLFVLIRAPSIPNWSNPIHTNTYRPHMVRTSSTIACRVHSFSGRRRTRPNICTPKAQVMMHCICIQVKFMQSYKEKNLVKNMWQLKGKSRETFETKQQCEFLSQSIFPSQLSK